MLLGSSFLPVPFFGLVSRFVAVLGVYGFDHAEPALRLSGGKKRTFSRIYCQGPESINELRS